MPLSRLQTLAKDLQSTLDPHPEMDLAEYCEAIGIHESDVDRLAEIVGEPVSVYLALAWVESGRPAKLED